MPSDVPASPYSRVLVLLSDVTLLGGHLPGTALYPGSPYDLRFLSDRLAVFRPGEASAEQEFRYSAIRSVEVVSAAREPVADEQPEMLATVGVAGELVELTTARLETILRVETAAGELFFETPRTTREDLRIALSAALAAIRDAQPRDVVDDLSRLARMLDDGLLTRDEFDQLKADLLHP
jgi:hypothetical protein